MDQEALPLRATYFNHPWGRINHRFYGGPALDSSNIAHAAVILRTALVGNGGEPQSDSK